MRAVILVVMVLLSGCDDFGPRRYELVSVSTGVYLVDTKTGRVWKRDTLGDSTFVPERFLMDSSPMIRSATESLGKDTKTFIKDNYSLRPNTWGDFFRGLGK